MKTLALVLTLLVAPGCASLLGGDLPDEPSPLADMDEPLELHAEPDDETTRATLDLGGFTGITVASAMTSLDEMDDEPTGVVVVKVVENSPADAAGVRVDDVLTSVDSGSGPVELAWPSEWRKIEIAASEGDRLALAFDRAGALGRADVRVSRRVRAPGRRDGERFREEDRVGVVLRTATEVEARAVGLGPGGGAVVVGLSRGSPWRRAGIRFGDLIREIDGREVSHPQVILDVVRDVEEGDRLMLAVRRDGEDFSVGTAVSQRGREVRTAEIPLLFSYENDRGSKEVSVLLGLVRHRTTPVAWDWRLLWFVTFGGGDSALLEEED